MDIKDTASKLWGFELKMGAGEKNAKWFVSVPSYDDLGFGIEFVHVGKTYRRSSRVVLVRKDSIKDYEEKITIPPISISAEAEKQIILLDGDETKSLEIGDIIFVGLHHFEIERL